MAEVVFTLYVVGGFISCVVFLAIDSDGSKTATQASFVATGEDFFMALGALFLGPCYLVFVGARALNRHLHPTQQP